MRADEEINPGTSYDIGTGLTHEYSSGEKQNSSHKIPILEVAPSRDDLAVQKDNGC